MLRKTNSAQMNYVQWLIVTRQKHNEQVTPTSDLHMQECSTCQKLDCIHDGVFVHNPHRFCRFCVFAHHAPHVSPQPGICFALHPSKDHMDCNMDKSSIKQNAASLTFWYYSSTCCTLPRVRPRHIMHRLFLNVGYDLSEQQLLPYFAKFGAIKDLYLPKYVSGRNKGYGFLTYASKSAPSSVAQQPRHVVDGIVVQVRRVDTPFCFFIECAFVFASCSLSA